MGLPPRLTTTLRAHKVCMDKIKSCVWIVNGCETLYYHVVPAFVCKAFSRRRPRIRRVSAMGKNARVAIDAMMKSGKSRHPLNLMSSFFATRRANARQVGRRVVRAKEEELLLKSHCTTRVLGLPHGRKRDSRIFEGFGLVRPSCRSKQRSGRDRPVDLPCSTRARYKEVEPLVVRRVT